MTDTKMSADEVIAVMVSAAHELDPYSREADKSDRERKIGRKLDKARAAVAALIEREAAQAKRIADLADCLERASDTLKYAYGSTCGNLHSEVNKTLNYLLSRAEARNG